jgi:hypothetical protein
MRRGGCGRDVNRAAVFHQHGVLGPLVARIVIRAEEALQHSKISGAKIHIQFTRRAGAGNQQAGEQCPEAGREKLKDSVVHDSTLFRLGQGQYAGVVEVRNQFQLLGIAIGLEDEARTLFKFIHAHKAKLGHCELVS